jgi:hypothetical protein
MRFIIDIDEDTDGIEGRLRREDEITEHNFSGWLQLIGLLEPPARPSGAGG